MEQRKGNGVKKCSENSTRLVLYLKLTEHVSSLPEHAGAEMGWERYSKRAPSARKETSGVGNK